MTTAQLYAADLAAINAMPVRWFRIDGDGECSLGVLQMEHATDEAMCAWAERASVGDVFHAGAFDVRRIA